MAFHFRLESGDFLLLESGDKLLLEEQPELPERGSDGRTLIVGPANLEVTVYRGMIPD